MCTTAGRTICNMIGLHMLPFMIMEKSYSDCCCTVMDLSFPKGLPVNYRISKGYGYVDSVGLEHHKLYVDLLLLFRYHMRPVLSHKVTDSVRYILNKNGHNALLNYTDDFIYCGFPSPTDQAYEF